MSILLGILATLAILYLIMMLGAGIAYFYFGSKLVKQIFKED